MLKKRGKIPSNVEVQLLDKMSEFNKNNLSKAPYKYTLMIRGRYIYLIFCLNDNSFEKVGRLTYDGGIEDMDFAIYKYSKEKYDQDDFMFPGAKHLDGILEGAMKAGISAYKPSY